MRVFRQPAQKGNMRTLLFAILFVILLAGSFLAGAWYRQGETAKIHPPAIESPSVNADTTPDTVADTDMDPFSLGTK